MIYIYDHNSVATYTPSEPSISLVGGLLLWIGWIFFNSASGYEIVDLTDEIVPTNIAINTFVSAASAGVSFAVFEMISF